MTARHYAEQRNVEDATRRLFQHWREPRWRETILLAVGHHATRGTRRDQAQALIRSLLDADEPDALILAAESLDEANARTVTALDALLRETIELLLIHEGTRRNTKLGAVFVFLRVPSWILYRRSRLLRLPVGRAPAKLPPFKHSRVPSGCSREL